MKKKISLAMILVMSVFLLVGCTQAQNVTQQIKDDADEFKITRRITAINLRTDKVLYEIEGLLSYTVEADGDLSIVAKVGANKYQRDSVGIGQAGNGVTYLVQQIEPNQADPYHYHIKIYARVPDIDIVE